MSDEEKKDNLAIPSAPLVVGGKLQPAKPVGVRAKLEEAKKNSSLLERPRSVLEIIPNRIYVAIDDSGSMAEGMDRASGNNKSRMLYTKEALKAFLDVCEPTNTAVGMECISTGKNIPLTNEPASYYTPFIQNLYPDGGTPLFETLERILDSPEGRPTRVIAMSDGEATHYDEDRILGKFKESNVPVDAVFLGTTDNERGISTMRRIAEKTGGLFIHFKDGYKFAQNFKMLAPAFRAMLAANNSAEKMKEIGG